MTTNESNGSVNDEFPDLCGFCQTPAIASIGARHGHEELTCEEHLLLALRTCAEREYVGEALHIEFKDGTGIAR